MCGITGVLLCNRDESVEETNLQAMNDAIRHRGPDSCGTTCWGNVGFGTRRLAILDIEHGQQPMNTADGSVSITYNGEVYNYVELRSELRKKGYSFRTDTDTEVILYMYEEYGEAMFDRLNGMFALGLYDHQQQKLLLSRDRFGQKPLYIYEDDDTLLFASEIKALLEHPNVTARPDPVGVHQYLTFQHCLGDQTMFENIRKVPPAHYMTFGNSGEHLDTERYWWFDAVENDDHSEKWYVNQLRDALEDAVDIRLRSDVPVGAYLSGGIDSSTIATIASIQSDQELPVFSGYFEEEGFSELEYAESVAEQNGNPHHTVCPTAADFESNLRDIIYYMDEPAGGPGVFPQLMVSRLVSDEATVVLGGQGGDELFGGYARYLVLYLEACINGSINGHSAEDDVTTTLADIDPDLSMLEEYTPLIKHFWGQGLFEPPRKRYFDLMNRMPQLDTYFTDEFISKRDDAEIFETYAGEFDAATEFTSDETVSLINSITAFDIRGQFRALLQVEDRMSMAASVESRLPFLDYRIAELAYKAPSEYKFSDGNLKSLLQKAVNPYLPEKVRNRQDKMGFPVPYVSWLQGPLRDFAEDILLGDAARERGIYKMDAIEELLDTERPNGRKLWGILCLELWFQTFIDSE